MRFLADQDVYAGTIGFLSGLGHEVSAAAELGLARAEDAVLLPFAREQQRILLTRDRDFGSFVFAEGAGPGLMYLRALPSTQNPVHAELERVLTLYTQQQLQDSFLVIEPGRHRLRRLVPGQGTAGQ